MNYFLVNTVGKRRTKNMRKSTPQTQKYSQRFLGGSIRLTRGMHYKITEEQLETFKEELAAKQATGSIEVRMGSPLGKIYDFGTLVDTPKEIKDEAPKPEKSSDEQKDKLDTKVEGADSEEAGAQEGAEIGDFASMTVKELVNIILKNSDAWTEKELKKMKKKELLELLG